MSLADHQATANAARDTLREDGVLMQLSRETGRVVDKVTDEETAGVIEEYTGYGFATDITEAYARKVGAGNVESEDQLVYLEATQVEPDLKTRINTGDGQLRRIIRIQTHRSGPVPVLYVLQVRL